MKGEDVLQCAGEKLVPTTASMSSVYSTSTADKCIDGNEGGTYCDTEQELAPWLALDFGSEVKVSSVVIIARVDCCGDRTKNVKIRVSSTLPSGLLSGSTMFSGGQLLGTFTGPGTNGQRIEVTSDTELTGRYVVVQMDHRLTAANGLLGGFGDHLNLMEVTAWSPGRIFS